MTLPESPRGSRLDDAGARAAALSPEASERALTAWREHDAAHALHAPDRAAVDLTDAPRALVLDLLARPGLPRDLYSACARLGRLLADAGASPSLAAATLEGAAGALRDLGITYDPSRVAPARASVAEGYFAVTVERERAAARRAWEYPACVVRVDERTVAIVAGYPADDGEALADWAARVAVAASRDGYRRALVSGPDAAASELAEALGTLGVTLATSAETTSWWSAWLRR